MNLEQARLVMVKSAAASIYQSAAGLLADIGTEGQEKEIRTIADELSDHVMGFTFSELEQPELLAETALTT